MRLLLLCPHFRPDDHAATGEVISRIVDELASRGHRLHVVTSLPWYEHHRIEPGWEGKLIRHEDTEWGRITRVHPFPGDKTNLLARAMGFIGFTALALYAGVGTRQRPDAVYAMSPPITLGVAGWVVARLRRAPLVFNIQDVFPDVAVELGAITNRRLIGAARWFERFLYRRSDAVTVLSEDLADNVRTKLAGSPHHQAKVRVIPNFVDLDRFGPGPRQTPYRDQHHLGDRTVVMYSGNVGFSQSLDLMVGAARHHHDRDDLVFVINGDGAARTELVEQARGLDNLELIGRAPREGVPDVLRAADIHVVPLREGLARSSVPSKLYPILAVGRPVLASVDPGTEVARVVVDSDAGLAVPPDDLPAFLTALDQLLADPVVTAAMGERGHDAIVAWASPSAVAERYDNLFADLAGPSGPDAA
ncbi:MAG: glycosyltransferase family 4 protein [Actinomycetia bacterium]|nr:glycosyltransferase family 4 protein [Actinomycetes bacterium]